MFSAACARKTHQSVPSGARFAHNVEACAGDDLAVLNDNTVGGITMRSARCSGRCCSDRPTRRRVQAPDGLAVAELQYRPRQYIPMGSKFAQTSIEAIRIVVVSDSVFSCGSLTASCSLFPVGLFGLLVRAGRSAMEIDASAAVRQQSPSPAPPTTKCISVTRPRPSGSCAMAIRWM